MSKTSRLRHRRNVSIVPIERVQQAILILRGQRVLLDSDLGRIYRVETKMLVRAVKRNIERFPEDFMFQLSSEELNALRCQTGTSKGRGGRRYRPYAFTEHGALMLASVLRSEVAIEASVLVVRAFVRLRQLLASDADLARKLAELERKYDQQFNVVFDAIRELMSEPQAPSKPPIGYLTEGGKGVGSGPHKGKGRS